MKTRTKMLCILALYALVGCAEYQEECQEERDCPSLHVYYVKCELGGLHYYNEERYSKEEEQKLCEED